MRVYKKFLKLLSLVMITVMVSTPIAYAKVDNCLNEVKELVEKYYVESVPKEALECTDVKELVDTLKDPYSKYFTKEEYDRFVKAINNNFVGIGVILNKCDAGAEITKIIKSSPADVRGLKVGDVIYKIDEFEIKDYSLQEISYKLKGKPNTCVRLHVLRGKQDKSILVERKEFAVPTVEGEMLQKTAYIKISSFGEKTGEELNNCIKEVKKSNPESYIIDLRDNGGGYLNTALDVAGYFIGENLALMVEGKDGIKFGVKAYPHEIIDKNIIFLINDSTASASELLSAAVKDYEKATFIGVNSFGKGVAQSLFPLSNGDYLKLTTQRFYSPKGNVINKIGIAPDVKMEEPYVLQSAILLLSGSDSMNSFSVKLNGKEFFIDKNLAYKDEYKTTFKELLRRYSDEADLEKLGA